MARNRVLVTGATGKIGSAVAAQLLEKGVPTRAMVHREDERTTTRVAPATEAVVPDPPWRTAAAPGWNEVTVIRQRRLDTPSTRAVSVVQHLASLPVWERKARRVTVKPAGPRNGVDTRCGAAGAGRVGAVEAMVVAALPELGALVDVLRHRSGPDQWVRRIFAQFADGTQLDLAVVAEAQIEARASYHDHRRDPH